MKLKRQLFFLVALAALTTPSSEADARSHESTTRELAEMCVLSASRSGAYKIELDARLVATLTQSLPTRFAAVESQEHCDDGMDNNCNGQIDEGCVSDPEPTIDQACDSCMQDKCADYTDACIDDQDCRAAANCVIQHRCLDQRLGHLACICGQNVSIAECMRDTDNDTLRGACVAEFYQSPSFDGPPEGGQRLAKQTFTCMLRNCQASCNRNFYKDPP